MGLAVGLAPPCGSTDTYATPLRPWILEIGTTSLTCEGGRLRVAAAERVCS